MILAVAANGESDSYKAVNHVNIDCFTTDSINTLGCLIVDRVTERATNFEFFSPLNDTTRVLQCSAHAVSAIAQRLLHGMNSRDVEYTAVAGTPEEKLDVWRPLGLVG